jgi:NAD(P)-dependent dehydrogenase (short-subunit alcohol dehydrogenase family)
MTDINPPASTRVALVTGAARGIGAATAIALARRGIAPVLAVRDPEAARPVLEAVARLGVACRIETCDVADHGAVGAAVQRLLAHWKRLDIVVNNAGQIDPIGHIGDTDPAQWARNINVNLVGAYNVVHACLPSLLSSGSAAILNVSSGAAQAPREGWSAYCSSKAGLLMFSRALFEEYGRQGIAAFSLRPGVVDTEMQVRIRASGMNEVSRIPRAQLAPPDHAAGIIAWLCDRRPAHHAGKELNANDAGLAGEAGRSG